MSTNKPKPRRLVFRERIVFRTTSESLRLAEPDLIINNNNIAGINNLGTKKKANSSFQVTNVSHGPAGTGADSAEDESHSHSDDISRITDIETPSYSEDTFSRDTEDVDVTGHPSELNHLGEAGLAFIPSSSQFIEGENLIDKSTISIIESSSIIDSNSPFESSGNNFEASSSIVEGCSFTEGSTTECNSITEGNSALQESSGKEENSILESSCIEADDDSEVLLACSDYEHPKELDKDAENISESLVKFDSLSIAPPQDKFIGRFQVVKVESLAPFKRGRWVCHDYLDNSKHAPKDGYIYYNGRYLSSRQFEDIRPSIMSSGASVPVSFPAVLYICTCLPNPTQSDLPQTQMNAIPTFTIQGYTGYNINRNQENLPPRSFQSTSSLQVYSNSGVLHTSPVSFQQVNSYNFCATTNLPNTMSLGQMIPQEVFVNLQQSEHVLQSSNPTLCHSISSDVNSSVVSTRNPAEQLPAQSSQQSISVSQLIYMYF